MVVKWSGILGIQSMVLGTCWDVTWAAWTETPRCKCCPLAGGAGRCWARMLCMLSEHTPDREENHALLTKTKSAMWREKPLTYLQSGHSDHLVAVVEEVGQHIEDGGLRQNEFLDDEKQQGEKWHETIWPRINQRKNLNKLLIKPDVRLTTLGRKYWLRSCL